MEQEYEFLNCLQCFFYFDLICLEYNIGVIMFRWIELFDFLE